MFKEKVAEFTGNMLLKNAEVMPHFHRYSREYGKKFLKNANVMVIICGSLISMMESQVLAYNSPLYGRRTAQIRLKQITFELL